MKPRNLLIFILVFLAHHVSYGQINPLDSCGLDSNTVLNRYEISIIDSLFFRPFKTRKSVIDPKNGFDFKNKKIAFFSCTKNEKTQGDGLLSKNEFYNLFKPRFYGHAGKGLIVFNEIEKIESNGFDAVVIIDCPYDFIKNEALILMINKKHK